MVVTIEEGPFYLDGLLWCHQPMRRVTWRPDRSYQCGSCRRAVDALTVEVEVWELVTTTRPAVGTWQTPYAQRADLLRAAVSAVRIVPDGYLVHWLPDRGLTPVNGVVVRPNQGRWDTPQRR